MMNYRHLALLSIGIGLFSSLLTGAESPLETKVKAAYLYNFTKFINWPDQKGKPIRICVSGDSSLANVLVDLASKQGGQGGFSVSSGANINPTECQILYVSASDRENDSLLNLVKEQNILTVSDDPSFTERGGIVTLFSENGKIRFEINLPATRKTNLKISSKLLELAKPSR
jgi:YfiR/HmsC-like